MVEEHKEYSRGEFEAWELRGHAKVALRVPTEDEMVCCSQNLNPLSTRTLSSSFELTRHMYGMPYRNARLQQIYTVLSWAIRCPFAHSRIPA